MAEIKDIFERWQLAQYLEVARQTETFDLSGSGGNLVTAQLVNGDNRPVTLTLSGFDAGGGVFNFIAQALVAGP